MSAFSDGTHALFLTILTTFQFTSYISMFSEANAYIQRYPKLSGCNIFLRYFGIKLYTFNFSKIPMTQIRNISLKTYNYDIILSGIGCILETHTLCDLLCTGLNMETFKTVGN